ncbi:MAG: hypothetical protein Q8P45_02650 [Candidatus Harrisonbacteria bacterium]|nr:hypothetical protein [Candidatus Harrisonbacteria bacterium]
MMTTGDFVRKRKHLFWSTKNYDGLSPAVVVETILNYGDMEDVREMISLLGIEEVAKIFQEQISRPRNNYRPEVKNYFQLYFQKYAERAAGAFSVPKKRPIDNA